MSTTYKERIADKYRKALEMKASLEFIECLHRRTVSKLENCYDIQLIRKGFHSYFQNAVSEEYFFQWCGVYASLIHKSYELKTREDLAYDAIADLLCGVADNRGSLIKVLAEIEIHNEVLEGKREAEYFLATDCECFYVYLDEWTDSDEAEVTPLIDYLEINHRNKTYSVLRAVSEEIADGEDLLGNYIESCSLSRIAFEGICKGMAMMGYKKLR